MSEWVMAFVAVFTVALLGVLGWIARMLLTASTEFTRVSVLMDEHRKRLDDLTRNQERLWSHVSEQGQKISRLEARST